MAYVEQENQDFTRIIKKHISEENTEALQSMLEDWNAVEVSNNILSLKSKYQLAVIELLDREKAADVLNNLQHHTPVLEDIVEEMDSKQLRDLIEDMDRDDAADVLSAMDDEKASEVLDELSKEDREEITSLLQYDEDSAGGIMDPVVISIQKDITVKQATKEIKEFIKKKEIDEFYVIYVVDEFNHLIGSIGLSQLFIASDNKIIKDIMDPDVIAVSEDTDQEKVAKLAKEYDLVTVPVIDKHLKLVGRITSDDLMDVMHEEHLEDLGQIAGTGDEEVLETSVFKASRDRLPWLLLGLGGGVLAALVMRNYETAISDLPVVAYFIPLVAALGGNIAIQSSSLVVRGLATGEIRTSDLFKRTWKELRVGFLNGLICSILLFGIAWWLTDEIIIGITSGIALIIVVCLAAFVGTSVPILLKRMHMDPAVATGPFITTTNDLLGIVIYLAITISVYSKYLM